MVLADERLGEQDGKLAQLTFYEVASERGVGDRAETA